MSTGDGVGHRWRRNDEFCIAAGPVRGTAGLIWSIRSSGISSFGMDFKLSAH